METHNKSCGCGTEGGTKGGMGTMRTIVVFFVIIFSGTVTLFFLDGVNRINSPVLNNLLMSEEQKKEQAAIKAYNELEEKYKNDTYGGDTPEETMQLFIAALKAGNTDLAAKYFVVDKQEEWKVSLATAKEKGGINKLVLGLDSIDLQKEGTLTSENFFQFNHYVKEQQAEWGVFLVRNLSTKKWKLESL